MCRRDVETASSTPSPPDEAAVIRRLDKRQSVIHRPDLDDVHHLIVRSMDIMMEVNDAVSPTIL